MENSDQQPAVMQLAPQDNIAVVPRVGNGTATRSETLGHQELIVTYKRFEPLGPACLPV